MLIEFGPAHLALVWLTNQPKGSVGQRRAGVRVAAVFVDGGSLSHFSPLVLDILYCYDYYFSSGRRERARASAS